MKTIIQRYLGILPCVTAFFYPAATFAYECLIEPLQIVTLSPPVNGVIDKVLVKRADPVHHGQIVATLQSSVEKAALDIARHKAEQRGPIYSAEQRILFAKRKFSRRSALAHDNLIPPQEIDDTEAELRLAEADLVLAQEAKLLAEHEYRHLLASLELRTVRSPMDGIVMEQIAYPGEVADPSNTKKGIIRVAQLRPIQVRAILPKNLIGSVSVGQSAVITPEIPLKGRHTAHVTAVDKIIDAASGTFIVLMEMDNPRLDVPAGIRCTAQFETKR